MMSARLQALKDWINSLPEGSEIVSLYTSIYEDDAMIAAQDPRGTVYQHEIMGIEHPDIRRRP